MQHFSVLHFSSILSSFYANVIALKCAMTLFFLHPHLQNILNLILHDRLIPDLWIFGHKALSIFRLQQGQKSTSKYVNFLLNQPEPKQMLVLFEVTWKETACAEFWARVARVRGRILSTYLQTEECVWSPWSSGNLGAWCSLQVASSSSLWAVRPGLAQWPTVHIDTGSYQQVTLTVTLGQCLMSAHSTHAHIGTFIVYSSVDSCVVPLLIQGWGGVVMYLLSSVPWVLGRWWGIVAKTARRPLSPDLCSLKIRNVPTKITFFSFPNELFSGKEIFRLFGVSLFCVQMTRQRPPV